jgi:hypothetical protein
MTEKLDRAITRPEQDLLGRENFIRTLGKSLVEDIPAANGTERVVRSRGHVVGLTGEWGSGKSSILNLLAEHLGTRARTIVVHFNPWMFRGHEDLLDGFFNELSSRLTKSTKQEFGELLKLLDKYRGAIAAGARGLDVFVPGSSAGWNILNKIIPKSRTASAQESRKELEKKLKGLDLAIVVLIDELDRVEDEDVRAVAKLIKAIGDISGISYLVAYDPIRVIDALGRGRGAERTSSGEAYLEKIIQLVVPVRPLLPYEIKSMLQRALEGYGYKTLEGDAALQDRALDKMGKSLKTPRDIKRVVANFAAIEPMVHGEINALDVLFYSYLLVKAPTIRNVIAQDLDLVVDDPSEEVQIRRAVEKIEVSIETVFGKVETNHESILKWLFPVLSTKKAEEVFDRDRIRKRRNLLRLVYLGNPPHDISRKEIDDLVGKEEGQIESRLRDQAMRGGLRPFVDRFRDILPSLPENGDIALWKGIARSLVRDHDWINAPEPQRAVVDDLEATLRSLGSHGPQYRKRARAIAGALIADGDVLITSALLRSHIYRFGLAIGSVQERDYLPVIWDKTETNALIQTELLRYRLAISSGFLLKRLPDVDAVYAISNMGKFDVSLRDEFSAQLSTPEAIGTFAALIVPQGFITDRNSLEQIVDCELLLKRLEGELACGSFAKVDAWLANAVSRLHKILLRQDPYH